MDLLQSYRMISEVGGFNCEKSKLGSVIPVDTTRRWN